MERKKREKTDYYEKVMSFKKKLISKLLDIDLDTVKDPLTIALLTLAFFIKEGKEETLPHICGHLPDDFILQKEEHLVTK